MDLVVELLGIQLQSGKLFDPTNKGEGSEF